MNSSTALAPMPIPEFLSQGDLLGEVMHHGRNLVMSTRGYAELMASHGAPEQKREEWAGRIVRNLDRLEELYTRLDEFRDDSASGGERFSVALAVDCGCRLALNRLRKRGVDPHVDLGLEADPLVRGNGQYLSKSVAAFVENAIEADPQQTACVQLVREDLLRWSLSISDRGRGLLDEDRSRFGAAFFSRKEGRIGMGAVLGASLLGRLNMSFDLNTDPLSGTRITIQPRRGR